MLAGGEVQFLVGSLARVFRRLLHSGVLLALARNGDAEEEKLADLKRLYELRLISERNPEPRDTS